MGNNVSFDMLTMALKQLDATTIDTTNSKTSLVTFELSDRVTVSYICNAHEEGQMYLQRVKPYPIRKIKFGNPRQIVKFIEKDVKKFRNAANSSNFEIYLQIVERNYEIRAEIEKLFLEHNVDKDFMRGILKDLEQAVNEIKEEDQEAKIIDLK